LGVELQRGQRKTEEEADADLDCFLFHTRKCFGDVPFLRACCFHRCVF
jgi:hypothetical protein